MNYLLTFTLKHLLLLHSSSLVLKIKSVIALSLPFSIVTWFFTKISQWTISNGEFIAGVFTCIAIDHIIGSAYHAFKLKDFTIKKNLIGLITKLTFCAGAAILFEIIQHTVKETTFIYDYLKSLTRLMVILYPAGSAFMNMSALTNGVFPPIGWIQKIKTFNQDLDLDKIKDNKKQ